MLGYGLVLIVFKIKGVNDDNILPKPDKNKIGKEIVVCKIVGCTQCHMAFTGSTKRLETHLKLKHNIIKPDDSTNSGKFKANPVKQNYFCYLILMFIVTAGLSFRSVENKYFKELIQFLIENPNANFSPPSRRAIKKLAKQQVADEKEKVKTELGKIEHVAITADGWTSTKQKLGYVAATVHYFVKDLIMKSISLGVKRLPGSHTGERLADTIRAICDEFNIFNKVVSMTGDNAKNMHVAAKHLKLPYISCFAHVLNRIVVTTLANLKIDVGNDESMPVLVKCRKLIGTFNHSTQLTETLIEDQMKTNDQEPDKSKWTKLRLIQDVVTRWNSLYLMLSRLVKLKDAVKRVLHLRENTNHLEKNLTDDEYKNMEELCSVLEPFFKSTEMLSGEKYCTQSLIWPTQCKLYKKVAHKKSDSDFIKRVKSELKIQMDAYFYKYDLSEENGGLIAATILDPRFKQLKFLDKDADLKAYYKFAADVIEQKFPEFARSLDSRDGNLEKKKKHFLSDDEEDFKL